MFGLAMCLCRVRSKRKAGKVRKMVNEVMTKDEQEEYRKMVKMYAEDTIDQAKGMMVKETTFAKDILLKVKEIMMEE